MGLEDWDWRDGIQPTLTDEKYYSAPYSIRPSEVDVSIEGFCKAPDTLYIPNGRIEFVYNNNNDPWTELIYRIWFRVTQQPGETTTPQEGYYIYITPSGVVLRRQDDGIWKEQETHDLYTDIWDQLDPLAWNWFRVSWWSVAGVGLIVRLETKIGNTWCRLCDDFVGFTDMYTDRTYNRVGFRILWISEMNPSYIDNIKIYKAV